MSEQLVTRRSLVSLFSFAGLFAIAPNRLSEAGRQGNYSLFVEKLAVYYSDKKSAAEVGVRYLEIAPEEAEIGKLASLICQPGTAKYRQLARANLAEVRTLIASWQREDFEHKRIVTVSGWLLSETEARLCALAVLT